jgi:hypothetical protein
VEPCHTAERSPGDSCANAGGARADLYEVDFACAIYLNSATQVYQDRPQPLLRAVVVLRVKFVKRRHLRRGRAEDLCIACGQGDEFE